MVSKRSLYIATLIAIVTAVASPSRADSLLDATTPASAAMGGAYGAVAADNGAILLNPAGMSATRRYGAGAAYLFNNPYSESRIDLSVIDSVTSSLGVGFGYYRDKYHLSSLSVHRDTYALALSMGEPGLFSAGVTGRLDQFSQGLSGSSGTLGYGILFSPDLPFLNISLAALNLTRVKGNRGQLPPRLIDAGISLLLQGTVTVAFDAVKDLDITTNKNIDYHLGGEVMIINQIALRAGYVWHVATKINDVSAGIAWKVQRFSLSYAFIGGSGNGPYGNTQLISFTVYPF